MKTHIIALLVVASIVPVRAADSSGLPSPWQQQDIGAAQVGKSAQVAGAAKHADGVFTLQGTMDMWGPADGFHFVWQPVQGDVVLVACVTSMGNPGKVGHAKASLCLRESLDGGSRCVSSASRPATARSSRIGKRRTTKRCGFFLMSPRPSRAWPREPFRAGSSSCGAAMNSAVTNPSTAKRGGSPARSSSKLLTELKAKNLGEVEKAADAILKLMSESRER